MNDIWQFAISLLEAIGDSLLLVMPQLAMAAAILIGLIVIGGISAHVSKDR